MKDKNYLLIIIPFMVMVVFLTGFVVGDSMAWRKANKQITHYKKELRIANREYNKIFEDRQRYYNAWTELIRQTGNGG